MQTYHFNSETKEYLYAEEAALDPLETEQQGQQVWLLPADSTFTAPPDPKDGFAIVWSGEAWEYTEDHRGKEYWLPGDTWKSLPRKMKDLGPLPDGALLKRPEKPFETVRSEALAAVDAATSSAILAGFDYEVDGETLHFSYDSFDQSNFNQTANIATLALSGVEGLPETVTWNAYRNYSAETGGELVRLTLTPTEFLSLYVQGASAHKATQMEVGGQRKAAIEAVETAEAVQTLLEEWGI